MKAFSRLLIAAIGAAAFVSCTQNGGLIYLNIQKTTKTNTSTSIPLDITVSDIVNTGTGASPYYVAAGKVYNGSVSNGSTNWSSISVPQAGGKDMLCNALAYDGTNLWGAFFSSDGETFKLAYATPGASWTEDTGGSGSPDGKQITYLGADSLGKCSPLQPPWSTAATRIPSIHACRPFMGRAELDERFDRSFEANNGDCIGGVRTTLQPAETRCTRLLRPIGTGLVFDSRFIRRLSLRFERSSSRDFCRSGRQPRHCSIIQPDLTDHRHRRRFLLS